MRDALAAAVMGRVGVLTVKGLEVQRGSWWLSEHMRGMSERPTFRATSSRTVWSCAVRQVMRGWTCRDRQIASTWPWRQCISWRTITG